MTPSVMVPGVTAIPAIVRTIPTAIIPRIIVPRVVIPRVIPAVPTIVVVRTIVPRVIPTKVVEGTVIPRVVPSSIVPRVVPPVDRGIIRAIPGVPRSGVPRLVSGPGVPTVVVQVDGGGIFTLVEIYFRHLVVWDEQGVDLLSTLHEDRGVLCLRDQQVGLFLEVGRGCHFCRRCVRCIVDPVLIPLSGGVGGVPRR